MKLQLDFDEKTIKIEERVNLGEFFNKLEEILPDLKWREFDLEVGSITNWMNPIIINPITPYFPDVPQYPWYTTCEGTYNIDMT